MSASQAQWKIAYFHQPIVGTDKPHDDPRDYFFQESLTHLLQAGVDLVLVGDSHTYSWTHSLTGFQDDNQDGTISVNEVDFVADTNRTYPKDAGLIQVVAGVGGRSLRKHPYADPFIASAYTVDDTTGPIEAGFAHLEVTRDRLTVSYISAETGQIVGDTNGNGIADANEPYFGRFQLVDSAVSRGDLDGNGRLAAADIDLLCAALLNNDPDPRFDLDGDGQNDGSDHGTMINSIMGVPFGDANLDGVFNSSDLVQILAAGKYENPIAGLASWGEGDWNCDGVFNASDLVFALQRSKYWG
jgi:hypothetical protein